MFIETPNEIMCLDPAHSSASLLVIVICEDEELFLGVATTPRCFGDLLSQILELVEQIDDR